MFGPEVFFRDNDAMNVIAHQTVSPEPRTIPLRVLSQPLQVPLPIPVVVEDVICKIAFLRDMMRHAGQDYSGNSRHGRLSFLNVCRSNQAQKWALSPFYGAVPIL
jgi:hypothetical protein